MTRKEEIKMTVKNLITILSKYPDNDRIILDIGDTISANADNEVLYAFKHKRAGDEGYAPVVVLQTRADIDVSAEIEATLEHYQEEGWDEVDALLDLAEIGYQLDDFAYDKERYEWAKSIAETHGIW
jgi:hypothetical protein